MVIRLSHERSLHGSCLLPEEATVRKSISSAMSVVNVVHQSDLLRVIVIENMFRFFNLVNVVVNIAVREVCIMVVSFNIGLISPY